MPNAAASFDDDFGIDAPTRRQTRKKPRAAAARRKTRRRWFDMGRVARYAAVGMSATIAVGIVYNALVSQKGHLAAPLFGRAAAVAPHRQVAAGPAPRPAVQHAPVAPDDTPDDTAVQQYAQAPVAVTKPRRGATEPRDTDQGADAIARLLQTGASPASHEKSDAKTISAAQRALAKLGFPVKANGTLGPATRKAIEGFERKQHMPINGELTHRVVKVLSAESGVRID